VIQTTGTQRQRFHDDGPAMGEARETPSSGKVVRACTTPAAVIRQADRVTATVDVGPMPGRMDAAEQAQTSASDHVIGSRPSAKRDGAGRTVTDPMGIVGKTYKNNLGERRDEDPRGLSPTGTPNNSSDKSTEYTT